MNPNPNLQPFGLYHPDQEHDACGVGFVADIKGRKSHRIVEQGVEVLANLAHRGACGCDPETGDGAGILVQIPDKFFRRELAKDEIELPEPGQYGVGMVFLPPDKDDREAVMANIDSLIAREGARVLGWRDVPVDRASIGEVARREAPHIAQIFIGGFRKGKDLEAIERKLYVIRKVVSPAVRGSALHGRDFFYWVSLSTSTIVYKGLMLAHQIPLFYADLRDPDFETAIAIVHQRYSTNTFPSWELAHPYRFLAHNGEINTLRGNSNWMHAREQQFRSELFGDDVKKLVPIIMEGASDSAAFDNVLELLLRSGRSLPHAVMMMIPEAWEKHDSMSADRKAFYEYHASIMEPWDGPASMAFTDGRVVGAILDRNGLRPSRYWVTKDGLIVMASEAGVLQIPPSEIESKGRLQPGRMFLVDTVQGRIIPDEEVKSGIASRKPYGEWLKANLRRLSDLPAPAKDGNGSNGHGANGSNGRGKGFLEKLQAFGYTREDVEVILTPMARNGEEPTGSMGNDTPPAVLSDRPQLLYNYFKQLFAQVTNPPLDAIREELVTALRSTLGAESGVLGESPESCRMLALDQPILNDADLAKIKALDGGAATPGLKTAVLPTLFPRANATEEGLLEAMDALCARASEAIEAGATILVLSDRGIDAANVAIPALLATAGVHHHLIREGTRTRCGLVVESGEPREVHHFALLLGYGACAINPWLALELLRGLSEGDETLPPEKAEKNYVKAIGKGMLKVMSKMGISTVASYRGAQIFEAVGLDRETIHRYFTWTPSRIEGVGIDVIAREALARHQRGFPDREIAARLDLDNGGSYQWRRDGERHYYNPETIAKMQHAVRAERPEDAARNYKEFAKLVNDQSRRLMTLRGLLDFKLAPEPIHLDQVEPASEIVKRFATGAMSFGSISAEAHETLAIAMNRIGGRSNTGEGGEDPARFIPDPETGDSRKSKIKQVASGRFGVTSHYLVNSEELQIKMAQGAKPGEGGQLPGHKVSEWIARVRHSTPGVGLISPPPHHDIYSIEDLAQLIHDLKNANPDARISVKLVSEVGVGTVAAGVAKGKADVVLISGDSGGTGASPQTSIKHAGLPWELGLAETHQVLVKNRLRGRIVVQTDGQLKTGRDVAIACLLGAEEFGFATAPLVALGCIMMRKCHLNTCPVGIATQDEALRKKFAGKPEHVVNYMFLVAEELREIMASMGFRTIDEMVGRTDRLETRRALDHWKAKGLDLRPLLAAPEVPAGTATHRVEAQDHGLEASLDMTRLLEICRPAIERGEKVEATLPIRNINRTVGAITGSAVSKKHGAAGLPEDTIRIKFQGSAGQSFAAFLPKGMTFTVEGDVNDYFGKGLSGGRLIAYPPKEATFVPEDNILVGNVAFYGATDGEAYMRGQAGERFCVRNSGVRAVVEGVGDHGCEYMTGGRVVILGPTGRNFAAGMSGGVAYVLDLDGTFPARCNKEMVTLERLEREAEIEQVRGMIERHRALTGSTMAERLLADWDAHVPRFVKVMPNDYRRVLLQWAQDGTDETRAELAATLVGAG